LIQVEAPFCKISSDFLWVTREQLSQQKAKIHMIPGLVVLPGFVFKLTFIRILQGRPFNAVITRDGS
jgi:hypothetical protein